MDTTVEIMRGNLNVTVDVGAGQRVQLGLSSMALAVADFTDFWTDYFAPKFYADVTRNYASEGGSVGGWAPLSPHYAAWKAKHAPNAQILELSGDLLRSVTMRDDPNAVFEPSAHGLRIGTRVPYGVRHQEGLGLPRRMFLFIADPDNYRRLMRKWALDKWRGLVRAGGRANDDGVSE